MHILNKFRLFTAFFLLLLSCIEFSCPAQNATTDIRLNQVGFLPGAPKIAVVKSTSAASFQILSSDKITTYYTGKLETAKTWTPSGESVQIADFSSFQTSGNYILSVEGIGTSFPFTIEKNYLTDLSKASIKAYYFQRASTALPQQFAGKWSRAMGHPDNEVIVLPSAAGTNRPAGTIISTPRGWYDAGDYNKYIVNSGISTYTLLAAYEQFPLYFDTLKHNIPESSNGIPDIIDECLWNIRWMLSMQDPNDGGVYNKTTNAAFDSLNKRPDQAITKRYVVAKGTTATLDFCAVMAQMSRIALKFNTQLPGLADSCLKASKYAWEWANAHPAVSYSNPPAKDSYPAVSTGGYGDMDFSDEKEWAAAELFITTKDPVYYNLINLKTAKYGIPEWQNVRSLGLMSLAFHRRALPTVADTAFIKEALVKIVATLKDGQKTSAYKIPEFTIDWGSNSFIANTGMMMLNALQITGDYDYYDAALSCIDYIYGRNATTYSFVTGFGSKPIMHPHHRLSISDGIVDPIPGWLSGGPQNKVKGDGCVSTGKLPATTFLDGDDCYTTNEIAINWNAPLVFLSSGLNYRKTTQYVLSTKESSFSNLILLHPNPASFLFNCRVLSDLQSPISFSVMDMHGNVKIKRDKLFSNDEFTFGAELENGIYVLQVIQGNKSFTQKIIKSH